MEVHPIVWGLDIGHTSIKAVRLSRAGEKVTVLGYAIEPIPTGEGADHDEGVVQALTALAQREEIATTPVVCSLSGRQIFSRTINIPIINAKKVDKMVELEARQQIPGNFDEVRWGYHMSPSLDGDSYDVALFAARNEIIDDLIAKTRKVGINLVGISITSLAVYNYVQFDQDFSDDEAVIVLDVGAENTDLVVYKGDTLWMRNLGVSGNDITRAFMKKFRVSFEEAETLKCQVGESRQAEKIFKVIEGSLGELVSEVQRSLGFYKSQNPEAEFESTVVSGNTFKLPNLTQYMADRLGYAIITLVEMERIQIDDSLDRDHFLEDLQTLGTAMGLALQGVGLGKAKVNLLPSSLRIQSLLKAKRWAMVVILVLLPVFFTITYMIEGTRLQANHRLTEQVKKSIKSNKELAKKSKDVIAKIDKPTKAVQQYSDYALHIGTLRAVEAGILGIIEDIATDGSLLPTNQAPIEAGGDPLLQPIYLDRLEIPAPGELARGVASFKPLSVTRKIRIKVRCPEVVDLQEVNARLRNALSELRVTPAMWRVHHPGGTVPEADQLPRLLKNPNPETTVDSSDTWYYVDPNRTDATGSLVASRDQQDRRQVRMRVLSYTVDLGPIQGL